MFDEIILTILREHNISGAGLAIAHEGRLVLARGYGYADTTATVPVHPDHRFRIASVSKPITAAAILNLMEADKLQLDDKVLELLTDIWPMRGVYIDPHWYDITVRDLLYHAGGFDREESFDPMFFSTSIPTALGETPPLTARMAIRYMLGRPLDFTPGARQAYSNFGYAILGRVIEAVTGRLYGTYVREEILEPGGVHHMQLGRSLLEHRAKDEVRYYAQPITRPAVFPGVGDVPLPYGAFALEAMDSHGGWTPHLLTYSASLRRWMGFQVDLMYYSPRRFIA